MPSGAVLVVVVLLVVVLFVVLFVVVVVVLVFEPSAFVTVGDVVVFLVSVWVFSRQTVTPFTCPDCCVTGLQVLGGSDICADGVKPPELQLCPVEL